MGNAGRIVIASAGALLVAACSAQPDTPATVLTPISPSHAASRSPAVATVPSATAAVPGPDSSTGEAIAWVEAAGPADAAGFHVALRGGTTTPLGDDIAFTTPAGTSCMTDLKRTATGLACLVDLRDPPPAPPDVYGVWKGGWVDFDGTTVRIGSAHGDPGRFAAGQGVPLPEDRSLAFGDFRCRADAATLVCVNYSRRAAVRYSDTGIDAYGCTRQNPPVTGAGISYSC